MHFIAPYDPVLDSTMTQVQQESEVFFTQLQAPQANEASYEANKTYYLHVEATLHTLLTRAQAVPKNERVAAQIESIEKTIEIMQRMHSRDGTLNAANLSGDRDALESEFRSFFALELALRTRVGSVPSLATAPTVKGS